MGPGASGLRAGFRVACLGAWLALPRGDLNAVGRSPVWRKSQSPSPFPGAGQKNGDPCGAAKFREETSKKADSAARGRIAAMHKLGDQSFVCKRYFALQHRKMLDTQPTGW